jgi:Family of unknown function (DUF6526)
MAKEAQNFRNHSKVVPAFHLFVLPMLIVNLVSMIVFACRHFSYRSVEGALTALALLLGIMYARMFALKVQDRVIRLEMRLRLAEILPADLRGQIGEFTLSQLIALRFASDAELPALARKVLDEKIGERKVIKAMVQNWQADELRA